MNADLAAVSRRPAGKAGYPLRNRSTSSNSGEGSQTRPDPNRYKKYLSLRNRKILDRQHGANQDECNSNHTASQRTIDSQQHQAQAQMAAPLQPILKSTSSRVSDLRYKVQGTAAMDGTTERMQKTAESLEMMNAAQTGDGSQRAPRDHSPLRVKSQKSNDNLRSTSRNSSQERRERSPIQVYRCEQPLDADQEANNKARTQETMNTRKNSQDRSSRSRKDERDAAMGGKAGITTSATRHDPFKSTTEQLDGDDDEEDFHFDFDQDGQCSYVNTTLQSEQTTPNEARKSAKRGSSGGSSTIQQLGTLSQKVETLAAMKKASIRAYADELKYNVKSAGDRKHRLSGGDAVNELSDEDENGEDSSGYVIDYEQVLKDNSGQVTPPPQMITDYRDDVGQDTILEQTQEAIETDSSPDAFRRKQNNIQNSNKQNMLRQQPQPNDSPVAMQEQIMQQQKSPQFRRNFTHESEDKRQSSSHARNSASSQKKRYSAQKPQTSSGGYVDEVSQVILKRKPGTKDSPTIRSISDHHQEQENFDGANQHRISTRSLDQEPIITFENRQSASTRRTENQNQQIQMHLQQDEHQIMSSSGRSAETGEYHQRQYDSLLDKNSRFQPYAAGSQSQMAQQHHASNDISANLREKFPGVVESNRQDNQHHIFNQIAVDSEPRFFVDDIEDDGDFIATPSDQLQRKQHNQKEYDLSESNRKIAQRNEEIEQQFEKQGYGSQPPSGNLIVTCIIRQPMDTVGINKQNQSGTFQPLNQGSQSKYRSSFGPDMSSQDPIISTARTSKSHYNNNIGNGHNHHPGSNKAQGISSSVGPTLNRHSGLNKNKSQNGLDISRISSYSGNRSASRQRGHSQDSRSNLSAGGTRRRNSQPKTAGGKKMKMEQNPISYRHPHILTTQLPSKYVLRSPPGLQAQLLNILLKSEIDVKHCQLAFDEHGIQSKLKGRKTMKVFEFDNCIGETKAHSLALGLEQHVKWISQTRTPTDGGSSSAPKNVIFVFGQSDALKTQLLNVMQPNSLINQCLKTREVRFLRVSTYHMNQEYLLAHKTFGSKQQMRREIGMELREAFRERDLNAKKIALKLSTYSRTVKADDVKLASHLIIQLDDLIFIDLADIDNLKDTSMAKKISADFSVVTNAILSMSPFYKDHDFGKVEEDRFAPYMDTKNFRSGSISFKNQISRLVTNRSRVLLLCCVIQCSMAGTQAVDYCHKIRSYFHGSAASQDNSIEMTPTRRMQVLNGDVSMETEQNVNAFRQLGGLISEVSKARAFIDKIFASKTRGEPLKRSRNQLKEMVACLRDDVSDLLNSLAANNENYIHQLKKIREVLQAEIYYMREKVAAMRSINKRRNSVGGNSSRKSSHAICILPKSIAAASQQPNQNQSSSSKPTKRGNSSNAAIATNNQYDYQNRQNQSTSQLHHQHQQRANNQTQQLLNRNFSSSSQTANKAATTSQAAHQHHHNQPHNFRPISQNSGQASSRPQSGSRRSNHNNNTNPQHQAYQQQLPGQPQQRRNGGATNLLQQQQPQNTAGTRRQSRQSAATGSTRVRSNSSKQPRHLLQQQAQNEGAVAGQSRFSTQKLPNSKNQQDRCGLMSAAAESYQNQVVSTTQPDDFRKQTLTTLNQQYLLSGAKSSQCTVSGGNHADESTITPPPPQLAATTEKLHQEVFALKEQLKQAIEFSEEQAEKRKQAEQNCIKVAKQLAQAETQMADLEDRIIAKDQTIRSLESQLDFHKSKLEEQQFQRREDNYSPSANQMLQNASMLSQSQMELEVLKIEKAQTDQMNQEILGQISQLKEALSVFQEQERTNQSLLRRQAEKDAEMHELKSQVATLLMQSKQHREVSPAFEIKQMRQQLSEMQHAKDKYRDEALQLKQEIRQQKYEMQQQAMIPERGSRERKRNITPPCQQQARPESQDREPLHMNSKLSAQNYQTRDQDQHNVYYASTAQQPTQTSSVIAQPQQKSLNTIKNMIRDFKEQRKGLMRTTSSKEALKQQQNQERASRQHRGPHQQQQPFKRKYLRNSQSRENDERANSGEHGRKRSGSKGAASQQYNQAANTATRM